MTLKDLTKCIPDEGMDTKEFIDKVKEELQKDNEEVVDNKKARDIVQNLLDLRIILPGRESNKYYRSDSPFYKNMFVGEIASIGRGIVPKAGILEVKHNLMLPTILYDKKRLSSVLAYNDSKNKDYEDSLMSESVFKEIFNTAFQKQ